MCAEDLENITVVIEKIGGPKEASNNEAWEKELQENSNLWSVISRQSIPLPIWKMIQVEPAKFKDPERFAEAMGQEWKESSSWLTEDALTKSEQVAEVLNVSGQNSMEMADDEEETEEIVRQPRVAVGVSDQEVRELERENPDQSKQPPERPEQLNYSEVKRQEGTFTERERITKLFLKIEEKKRSWRNQKNW